MKDYGTGPWKPPFVWLVRCSRLQCSHRTSLPSAIYVLLNRHGPSHCAADRVIYALVTLRRGVRLCLALLKEETLLPYVITGVPRIRGRRIYISLATPEPPQFLSAIPLGS